VRRDQIFIVHMDDVIYKTASIINSLSKFLRLSRPNFWGNDAKLPSSNVNDVKDLIPCDCATYDKLKNEYDNLGTVPSVMNIIRSPLKHPTEPDFPNFVFKRKCT
jgi:hypothetical protein